ncbi:MAG: BLUF domain-containing protein [Pseudomonadota bacterium]
MQLYSLLYVSRSLIGADSADMDSIALKSQTNNAIRGITGMLYYDNAAFLQVLEGVETDVRALFDKIAADTRHDSVRMLGFQPVSARSFGGWSMGLYDGRSEGGLLQQRFGPDLLSSARGIDVPEVMRFLRDLSLGREDVYALPSAKAG